MVFLQKDDHAIGQLDALRLLGMEFVEGRNFDLLPWLGAARSRRLLCRRLGSGFGRLAGLSKHAAAANKQTNQGSRELNHCGLLAAVRWRSSWPERWSPSLPACDWSERKSCWRRAARRL